MIDKCSVSKLCYSS